MINERWYITLCCCRWFDISFNRLSQIKNLSHLVDLQKVFLCANRITIIENLEHLTNLTTLELGDNRIRVSEIVDLS